ncbi:uncharacterized protein PGTG_21058 [Puccinia graminis f. sp. tritici CRL 75-36-700-3]|uniref:Uncharacterized protein n=2 Tax=Puccinia graminis f. sp. tritici TaxID=56615 RepID=H6QQ85_PUCGT|nr:uncharacterized protein PGTG_21058 [Puccinia graminis f. sp. tritici CRL 75-36-700-3]EHS64800.1 hypothetical protein PGTG_21058 [Puccinia graminis f. sp. tritici CRL 75-36-700-3]
MPAYYQRLLLAISRPLKLENATPSIQSLATQPLISTPVTPFPATPRPPPHRTEFHVINPRTGLLSNPQDMHSSV